MDSMRLPLTLELARPFLYNPCIMRDEILDWLELSLVPGVGPKTFFRLIDHFSSARCALDASASMLRKVPEINGSVIEAITAGCKVELHKTLQLIEKNGVEVITFGNPDYPERLKTIPDPPPIIYVKGALVPGDANAISIVGSRRATHYGKMAAAKFAEDLGRMGFCIVSGLAYGVDAAAHKGALAGGGRTIAVLGSGVDVVYPKANQKIYDQIPSSGALISEFPMGTQPDARFFPMRNRIVSGLSLGTLVIEAPRKSGALITVRHALDQGREVFAIPGNIFSPYSEGCHKLIKDGAKLVENIYDIIEEVERNLVGIQMTGREDHVEEEVRTPAPMSPNEKKVFNFLSMTPSHIDEIGETCDLTASQTASSLVTLEIRGLIQQLPGKLFIRRV
ncbi:DNA-protecting protein DprA [Candidatus Poribacteria bacterium]|nr:DNA-protecting protein DprA [Candidatus Poribacteria bacterium]